MIGIRTDARRRSGASISIAARRTSRSRRRTSALSSKRRGIPRLRIEHRNAFDGVIEAQRRTGAERNRDRRLLARPDVARQLDPPVGNLAFVLEQLRGQPVYRLALVQS